MDGDDRPLSTSTVRAGIWPGRWPPRRPALAILVAGLVALVPLYLVTALGALTTGHGWSYPLNAVAAVFRGNRALPEHRPFFGASPVRNGFSGVGWAVVISLLLAAACLLLLQRALRGRTVAQPAALLVGAGLGLLIGLIVVLFGTLESGPKVQSRVSSSEGIREIGAWAWLLAGAAWGAVVGLVVPAFGAGTAAPAPSGDDARTPHRT